MGPSLAFEGLLDFSLFFRFAVRRAALSICANFMAPFARLRPTPFSGRMERILIAPQDLKTSDPTAAGDIYSGYFAFAGKIVSTGGNSPFAAPSPSRAWSEALMGFGWLRDIRAADTALARANARTMVGDWIATCRSPRVMPIWDSLVVAQRLIAWLSHSPIILDGSDRAFYRRFMHSIRRQSAYLWRRSRRIDHPAHRLKAAIALTFVALCTDIGAKSKKRVIDHFIRQLNQEILGDGGHISRNPQMIVDLLAELLPLRHCFLSQSENPPAELLNAIDRMMPMIRLFRHGDGTLALFNGMSATAPDLIATLLAYQDTRSGPMETAGPSGYRRIQGQATILVMDVGKSPPIAFSSHAHAGCLSFELSDNGEKLIMNCGAPVAGQELRRPMARATAAHSTLVVHDQSSCRFAAHDERRYPLGEPIIRGPRLIDVRRDSDDISERIIAIHDGYRRRLGLMHQRSLSLHKGGQWLMGQDELQPTGPKNRQNDWPYAIRFHLHPGVEAMAKTAEMVTLTMPSGQFWTFTADAPVAIEESVLFATMDGLRRTTQLIIEAKSVERPSVKWSLVRGDIVGFTP